MIQAHLILLCFLPFLHFTDVAFFTNWRWDPPPADSLYSGGLGPDLRCLQGWPVQKAQMVQWAAQANHLQCSDRLRYCWVCPPDCGSSRVGQRMHHPELLKVAQMILICNEGWKALFLIYSLCWYSNGRITKKAPRHTRRVSLSNKILHKNHTLTS